MATRKSVAATMARAKALLAEEAATKRKKIQISAPAVAAASDRAAEQVAGSVAVAPIATNKIDAATRDNSDAAVQARDTESLHFLASHVDGFSRIRDADGMPLPHVAARIDDTSVMDLLVCLGCSLHGQDARGGTAVLEAADAGSFSALNGSCERESRVVRHAPTHAATRRCTWLLERAICTC